MAGGQALSLERMCGRAILACALTFAILATSAPEALAARDWWVSAAPGQLTQWTSHSAATDFTGRLSGDFNDDGRDDIADFEAGASRWHVTTGERQTTSWVDFPGPGDSGWVHPISGDFNNDGRDDIAMFHRPEASWWVSLAPGTVERWTDFSLDNDNGWRSPKVADFTGDGKDDIATFYAPTARWYLTTAKSTTEVWADLAPDGGDNWAGADRTGDFNGDGKPDLASFEVPTATWHVVLGKDDVETWMDYSPNSGWSTAAVVGNFNGDAVDDIATFYEPDGAWFVTVGKNSTQKWTDFTPDGGWSSPLAGNFDADAADEIATLHTDGGSPSWFVTSAKDETAEWVGLTPPDGWEVPVAGDFNGDNRDDIATRRSYTPAEAPAPAPEPEPPPCVPLVEALCFTAGLPALDPATIRRYAPVVYNDKHEKYFPMDPGLFIQRSGLKWAHGKRCANHYAKRAGTIDPWKLGARAGSRTAANQGSHGGPYVHAQRGFQRSGVTGDGGCGGRSRGEHSGVRHFGIAWPTHAFSRSWGHEVSPRGIEDGDGWYLDYRDDGRQTQAFGRQSGIASRPAYYEIRGKYVTYWFFYGLSRPWADAGRWELWESRAHEGDWESVMLEFEGKRPKYISYYAHHGRPTLGKGKFRFTSPRVDKRFGEHPVVYAARGGHGSYHSTEDQKACKAKVLCLIDINSEGRRWKTWQNMLDVTARPWYGFGGAWGWVREGGGFKSDSTGPLGPSRYKWCGEQRGNVRPRPAPGVC